MASVSEVETAMNTDLFKMDVEEYTNTLNRIKKDYKDFQTAVKSQLSVFTGNAADRLGNRFRVDDPKVEELLRNLEEMQKDLQYAYSEYVKCESDVSSIVDAIKV